MGLNSSVDSWRGRSSSTQIYASLPAVRRTGMPGTLTERFGGSLVAYLREGANKDRSRVFFSLFFSADSRSPPEYMPHREITKK